MEREPGAFYQNYGSFGLSGQMLEARRGWKPSRQKELSIRNYLPMWVTVATASSRTARRVSLLQGKPRVVAGGTSGIGRALALGLAEAGVDLVPSSRGERAVDETAQEIEGLGRKTIPRQTLRGLAGSCKTWSVLHDQLNLS
jgi:hypothetical protein